MEAVSLLITTSALFFPVSSFPYQFNHIHVPITIQQDSFLNLVFEGPQCFEYKQSVLEASHSFMLFSCPSH